jgi:undecaprenyl-diphosphatase
VNIIESIALGIIQGLTEFIPISSSGHEVLAEHFFGMGHDHLFLEFINGGTVLALVIYFWPKIIDLFEEVVFRRNFKLARNILIAAIPAGVTGFTFASVIEENPFFSNPWVVVSMMLLVGLVMIFLEKVPRLPDIKDGEQLSKLRSLGIGLAQAVALIPGTSRSGSTIIAGRLMGLNAAAAAEFSFLLSIPIMFGVLLKLALKSSDREYFMTNMAPIVVSNVFAFVSGIVAVSFLMKYLARHDLKIFGWYRVALSVVVMVVLLLQ